MNKKKKILFVVNPISGVKAKMNAIDLLKTELSESIDFTVVNTQRAQHATELTKQAVKDELDAVIAVGGDGTINEVGKALIHTKVALGVIPFGSGNGFARHMKIPLQAKAAVQLINEFTVKTIDTATLNNIPFLATAGLGFDAQVGKKFAKFGKRGFVSYSKIAMSEFLNFKPKKYRLLIDGEKLKVRAFVLSIANVGQYGNNAWIAPSASVTDGKLNVCILEPFPPHVAPDIIFRLFNKTIENSKFYRSIKAEEVRIIKPKRFHIDGEPRKKLKEEMVIRVIPESLNVIC